MMRWITPLPLLLVLLFSCTTVTAQPADSNAQPNIVLIISDDQRADTIHALGNTHIQTPSLDSLAKRGMVFDRAYCMGSFSGAVCAPSRAMILSGRNLFDFKGENVFNLSGNVTTFPQILRERGYETFFTGKWHNGKKAFARSFGNGGSIFFGGMGSHTKLKVHDFDPSGVYPKESRRELREFSSTEFASSAVDFLNGDRQNKPFLMMVSFTAPHDPRTPPEEYRAMYPPGEIPLPENYLPFHPFNNGDMVLRDEKLRAWPRTEQIIREEIALYYGMITHMDAQIGRILGALRENGLEENTVVIFTSDHGLAIGSHGLLGKQNLYEHSMRVPFIIAGPGIEQGRNANDFIYLFDLASTILDFAGAEDDGLGDAGITLTPLFTGGERPERTGVMTAYRDILRAVRIGDWKLIVYPKINRVQLFDLATDPAETNDLANDPQHRASMYKLLAWLLHHQRVVGDNQLLFSVDPQSGKFDEETAETKRSGAG